jgi:hypothetical protein
MTSAVDITVVAIMSITIMVVDMAVVVIGSLR